ASGSVRDVIEVPPYADHGLMASSMILSSRIDSMETGGLEAGGPFVVGPFRVIPRTSKTYTDAEELIVFYQVHGARPGLDGDLHLDLSYQFYLRDGDAWLPVGPSMPVVDQPAAEQAWSVPLHGWPAGSYRLETMITDRTTAAATLRSVLFEISGARP
ncbi:MAG TPA: hypothetical protein VFG76_11510, partial [Candidatus Polarisedimenticolia bacterium]|nr:hypothetical protein [Candidatus Polarisedimenticolia bacterium]